MPSEPHSHPRSRFPSPAESDSDGLVAIGGRLEVDWLLDAYRHGIFPWPSDERAPVYWWSPDPRAIFEFDGLHVSRRLTRRIRSGRFHGTLDRAFREVMLGCATAPNRRGGTWITSGMLDAYYHLHKLGHAHSVEVWSDGQLAGGVYGVSLGGLFAAESMFHRETDASKTALVWLREHLMRRGYKLWDIQQLTPHTASLGATEVSRREYLERLARVVDLPVTMGDTLEPA